MKHEQMAKDIIAAIGGRDNISNLVHCATRLRFTLKDDSKANDGAVTAIKGVLSLVKKGGQYQLVIGNTVPEVYQAVLSLSGMQVGSNGEAKKENALNRVLSVITGSLAGVMPVLAAAGVGKALLLVLTQFHLLDTASSTYYILNFVFDAGFYFMPVFISFSAAKVFGSNQYVAALLGCVLLHPSWTAAVGAGEALTFLGLPVKLLSYASTIIQSILIVWLMTYVEKLADKITPKIIKMFAKPLLTILICAPLALIVVGPLGSQLATWVGQFVSLVVDKFGFLAIALLSALYPWLVSTGMHTAIAPIGFTMIAQYGFDPVGRVLCLCSNMAQSAACLAVGLKSKTKEFKGVALSSAATAFIGGITEPAMYGVNLRLKKPMIAATIGGAASGLYAGIVGLKAYVMLGVNPFTFAMWIGPDGYKNLIHAGIATLIAVVVSFVLTWIIGFDDPVEDNEGSRPTKHLDTSHKVRLASPIAGDAVALASVEDATFSSGVLGKGMAVMPSEGKVYAPADGTVCNIFNAHHGLGLLTDGGVELLIHVGIDTVELDGKYFSMKVENGAAVKQGDLLLEFDLNQIIKEGYNPITVLIVTNSSDYLDVLSVEPAPVIPGDRLLTVV